MHNCVAYTDLDKIMSDIRKCAPFDFFLFYFSFSAENELYFYFSAEKQNSSFGCFIFWPKKKNHFRSTSTKNSALSITKLLITRDRSFLLKNLVNSTWHFIKSCSLQWQITVNFAVDRQLKEKSTLLFKMYSMMLLFVTVDCLVEC